MKYFLYVCSAICGYGMYLYVHDNVVLIIPPLIITNKQLLEGLKILSYALAIADGKIDK